MRAIVEDVESVALGLDREERARIAKTLIDSLSVDPEVERAWAQEIRERLREIDAGEARMIPAEAVLKEVEDLLA